MTNLLSNTLSQDAYWAVNKAIVRALDGDHVAAILLADLLSRRNYFQNRQKLEPDGSFFVLNQRIEEEIAIGKKKRLSATDRLKRAGFITVYSRKQIVIEKGYQEVNFYIIHDSVVTEALATAKGVACSLGAGGGVERSRRGCKNVTANKNNPTTTGNSSLLLPLDVGLTENSTSAPTSKSTNPTPEEIIEGLLASSKDYDLLKKKKTRKHHFLRIAETMRKSGYTQGEMLGFIDIISQYAVDSLSNARNESWLRDVETQWRISVNSQFPKLTLASKPTLEKPRSEITNMNLQDLL